MTNDLFSHLMILSFVIPSLLLNLQGEFYYSQYFNFLKFLFCSYFIFLWLC